MPGYETLNNALTEELLAEYLTKSSNPLAQYLPASSIKTITQDEFNARVRKDDIYINPFKYYTHPTTNLIIITTPIAANNFSDLLPHLSTLFPGKQLLLGLDGRGATEQHIVTAYVSADQGTIEIFDPKASNAKRFFSGEGGIGTLLSGLLRALNPFPKTSLPLAKTTANYYALGTQSFFDGVSCGYHNVANLLAGKELLEQGSEITRDGLLARTKNPVSEAATFLKEKAPQKVDSNFVSFVKKAWQDTMMPLENEAQRKALKFQHYFLGWPYQGKTSQKVLYFVSLRFLFQPVINLIRRPVEFTFNLISETANFLKNSLINWAPTNLFTQYLRSGLMLLSNAFQGLFKAAYLAVRTVTSPIVTYETLLGRKTPHTRGETRKENSESSPISVPNPSEKVSSGGSNVVTLFAKQGISTRSSSSDLRTKDFETVESEDEFTKIESPPPVSPGHSRDTQFGDSTTQLNTGKKKDDSVEGFSSLLTDTKTGKNSPQ